MIAAVAVLWIGVVLLMTEVHKNARPVFTVLGVVITVGLGFAWYDYNRKEENKTGAEHAHLMHPVYDEKNQLVAFGLGFVPPPGYPPYHPYFPYHHTGQTGSHAPVETEEMREIKAQQRKMKDLEDSIKELKKIEREKPKTTVSTDGEESV